jgi:nucleotide-binding universal stress UspA family protein
MMTQPTKSIAIPVDGSKNSLKSLDYLELMLGPEHDVKIMLCYILPAVPLIFENDQSLTKEERARLRTLESKNLQVGEKIIKEAKSIIVAKGFPENKIETMYKQRKQTIAKDVYFHAEQKRVDAILLTRRGKTDLKDFFLGEVSKNLVEYCQGMPLWVVDGNIRSKQVLVGLDASDNALRTVDHVGFMLSKTESHVTLFHTLRHLSRFIPQEVLDEAPELEETWRIKASREITPYIEKAKRMLLDAGFSEDRISVKVIGGTRSPADDIVNQAKAGGYGTIALGRRGISMVKEFFMGSVTSKVLQKSDGLAVWIVQ